MQVVDHFRVHFTEGLWKPGDTLPSLEVLQAELGVARVTLRDAVRVLSDEGLLLAERGKGTIVTEKARGHRPLKLETNFTRFTNALRLDLPDLTNITEADTTPTIAPSEGAAASAYKSLRRVHLRDGLRYCAIDLAIDQTVFQLAPDRFRKELALPVLTDIAADRLASARQKVRFGKCDTQTSQLLEYPTGEPVAFIRRVICDAEGVVVYCADVTYRADILEIDMDFFSG